MKKAYLFLAISLLSVFISNLAIAENCIPQCDSEGKCSMECSSEAPNVTAPTVTRPPSNNGGNSCKWAFDGVCDDSTYGNAQTIVCPAFTDNSDCQVPYSR